MSTIPNVKSPPQHQFRQDHSQRGHHGRKIDDYPHTPYPESEHSHSFQNLENINIPRCDSSELSVEEIMREFSPPRAEPYQPYHKSWYTLDFQSPTRSNMDPSLHENYEKEKDSHPSEEKFKNHHDRKSFTSFKSSEPKDRSLSRNQILLAAIGGAALAIGGKQLWDRRKPKSQTTLSPVHMAAVGVAGALAGYEGAEIYSSFVKKEGKPQKIHVSGESRSGDRHRKYYSKSQDDVKSRRSRSRHRSSSNDSTDLSSIDSDYYDEKSAVKRRSRDSLNSITQLQQLAKTALIAGAAEALRVRKEPGKWSGDKGKRVLTAAIGASAIDAVAEESGKHHILETIMRGLTSNRLVNGQRTQLTNRSGKSKNHHRSRSRNSNKDLTTSIATLVTAGVGALAGKKLIERSRSRSRTTRSRRRHRSPSLLSSSDSSIERNHRLKHQRSKSIVDIARKGLSVLGLSETKEYEGHRTNNSRQKSHPSESDTDSSWIRSNRHYKVHRDGTKSYRHDNKIKPDEHSKSKRGGNSCASSHRNSNRIKHKDKKNSTDSDSHYSSRTSTEDEKHRANKRRTKGKREV
ncbi:hypothetical protein EPUL_000740 [Erysiphe pulchra]|uniref:DUF3824 domain-containing protein n=1 Tax=Erysiphe pulchra TaxID=225359 RepID=A0A2S4Q225_9PEZI|nr:hypothetical protein EPUL_000740 [Erysiphe pulchra]